MADFIISPYALSFNSIKEALESYISNKSNVTTTWQDFYIAGAGQTILDLDAALGAFYAFHFIIGRRESYLPTAMNYNSVIGGAQALAYNASRGHNLYLSITLIPNETQTLPKWSVIGSYADYDVVLVEDATLNKDVETTIIATIGNSNAQSIQITSSDLVQFTFTDPNTTDDCRLILNSTQVPFSTEIVDAAGDTYVGITNAYGSMDVFYLNQGNYKYGADDILYLQYIERNNLKYGAFSPGALELDDIASEIKDIKCKEDRTDVEDKEHVRIAAPYKHEMNNVVRARKDYTKYLVTSNTNIIDANDKDVNPGLIAMTYLKKDNGDGVTLLTEEEKQEYIKSIMKMCPDGVATAFIEDPIKVSKSLDIKLWKQTGEDISSTITDDIDLILDEYRNKLQPTLDLEAIEHAIEQLPGVKVARVSLGASEYRLNTKYKMYEIVEVPNVQVGATQETWTMYVYKIQTQSGETEPDWTSASNVGERVIDNNIIWENSNKYTNSVSAKWKQDGNYELYADINVGYEIAPNSTTATEPLWGKITIVDGNVSFTQVNSYDSVVPKRQDNTRYIDSSIIYVTKGEETAIYKILEFTHKSGDIEPTWTDAAIIGQNVRDNALTWEFKYNAWTKNETYPKNTLVAIGINDKLYVYRADNTGVSGSTNPLNGEQTVQDNTIVWALYKTFDTFTEWEASTEFNVDDYILKQDRYFVCSQNNYYTSGEDAVFYEEEWISNVVDNNIVWKLDTYLMNGIEYNCVGGKWKPETPYTVGDVIITNSDIGTYIYYVYYTNGATESVNNQIFSVVSYCGTTSNYEPIWGSNTVVDNDILWTKTEDQSEKTWTANTVLPLGTIINTNEGYYTFTSILGTSGYVNPNWPAINNGQVEDNNITWMRIINTTSIPLKWNEYLDLKFNVSIV